jgi:hypothetical protein
MVGGITTAGLMVFGFRAVSIYQHGQQSWAPAAQGGTTSRVRLAYTPQLLRDEVLEHMARQFGVSVTILDVDISGGSGWVDIEIAGVSAAVAPIGAIASAV